MVRHYFVPDPISAAAGCMSEAAVPARLITSGDIPTACGTGNTSAAFGAINLPAIATSADQHLCPTTLAEEEASAIILIRLAAAAMTWTRSPVCAIMTRHSCSARCRARRQVEPAVRSAPCLPSSMGAKITARVAAAPVLTSSPESRLGYFSTRPPPIRLRTSKSLPKDLCGPLGSE